MDTHRKYFDIDFELSFVMDISVCSHVSHLCIYLQLRSYMWGGALSAWYLLTENTSLIGDDGFYS